MQMFEELKKMFLKERKVMETIFFLQVYNLNTEGVETVLELFR